MYLKNKTILLTGAAGGIGAPLARLLAQHKARLLLTDHHNEALQTLTDDIRSLGGNVASTPCNLLDRDGPDNLIHFLRSHNNQLDILINLAGRISFNLFHQESAQTIEDLWRINTIAPMQLTRMVLGDMLARHSGQIINIGSVYGSIGFPGFAAYSASKFGLRGFSEALRRELDDSGVSVTYIGPRYVKTPINNGNIQRMSETLKVNMDEPQTVASHIVKAIIKQKKEAYIGFPESLFVRINGALPQLVDPSVKKQLATIRHFASRAQTS